MLSRKLVQSTPTTLTATPSLSPSSPSSPSLSHENSEHLSSLSFAPELQQYRSGSLDLPLRFLLGKRARVFAKGDGPEVRLLVLVGELHVMFRLSSKRQDQLLSLIPTIGLEGESQKQSTQIILRSIEKLYTIEGSIPPSQRSDPGLFNKIRKIFQRWSPIVISQPERRYIAEQPELTRQFAKFMIDSRSNPALIAEGSPFSTRPDLRFDDILSKRLVEVDGQLLETRKLIAAAEILSGGWVSHGRFPEIFFLERENDRSLASHIIGNLPLILGATLVGGYATGLSSTIAWSFIAIPIYVCSVLAVVGAAGAILSTHLPFLRRVFSWIGYGAVLEPRNESMLNRFFQEVEQIEPSNNSLSALVVGWAHVKGMARILANYGWREIE